MHVSRLSSQRQRLFSHQQICSADEPQTNIRLTGIIAASCRPPTEGSIAKVSTKKASVRSQTGDSHHFDAAVYIGFLLLT
ncbi:hypothetical protein NQZ68_030933 [Dissostichus eleginoides]|nr:hypothetical protein NQZ68_030933 [Dissostichus eleginoides]